MDKDAAKYTLLEKITDFSVAAGLVLFWIVVLRYNHKHVQSVPTHFNIQGEADAFGSAGHLYLLAAINTLLIAGLYLIKWKDVPLNFGHGGITENKKTLLKPVMKQTLSLFAASLLVIFGIILMETLSYNKGERAYSFIFIFFAIKIPIVFYLAKTQDID